MAGRTLEFKFEGPGVGATVDIEWAFCKSSIFTYSSSSESSSSPALRRFYCKSADASSGEEEENHFPRLTSFSSSSCLPLFNLMGG